MTIDVGAAVTTMLTTGVGGFALLLVAIGLVLVFVARVGGCTIESAAKAIAIVIQALKPRGRGRR